MGFVLLQSALQPHRLNQPDLARGASYSRPDIAADPPGITIEQLKPREDESGECET